MSWALLNGSWTGSLAVLDLKPEPRSNTNGIGTLSFGSARRRFFLWACRVSRRNDCLDAIRMVNFSIAVGAQKSGNTLILKGITAIPRVAGLVIWRPPCCPPLNVCSSKANARIRYGDGPSVLEIQTVSNVQAIGVVPTYCGNTTNLRNQPK